MKKLISYLTLKRLCAEYVDSNKQLTAYYKDAFGDIYKKHGRWVWARQRCVKPITTKQN